MAGPPCPGVRACAASRTRARDAARARRYIGCVTTASPLEQARALQHTAGVRLRDDLELVYVRGEDAQTWLNGQVTADVREPKPGEGVYSLAVTVRGKIMADLWVVRSDGELAVLLPRTAADTVLASFEHQIIMEDVELVRDPALGVLSVQGPRAAEVIAAAGLDGVQRHRCDELGFGGELLWVDADRVQDAFARLVSAAQAAGGGAVDDAGFELARLRAGRPRFERDFGLEQYPQEAGLEARAVSFSKGCYLGQEVICTLENRGRLTRRLARLRAAAAQGTLAAGSELVDAAAKTVGKVTSAVLDPESGQWLALGYVKQATASAGAGAGLQAGGTAVDLQGIVE
jgi:tRNA-modifying protein YgfZ